VAGLSVTDQLARVVAKLPAGQVREGQLAMAKAVAECLDFSRRPAGRGWSDTIQPRRACKRQAR
jgi:hypothetical protein